MIVPSNYRGIVKIIEDKQSGNPVNRADYFVIDESGTCIAADLSLLFSWHRITSYLPDGRIFPSDTGPGLFEGDMIALREAGCVQDSSGRRYLALVIGTHEDTKNWYEFHDQKASRSGP